uniref:Uncharacterized protein n=1 Tax=Rhizophora mucronata TaxID=61149 RepID=A0A2P2P6P3_RHIMU
MMNSISPTFLLSRNQIYFYPQKQYKCGHLCSEKGLISRSALRNFSVA